MGLVPKRENELHWQIRHPYFFFWVSTGRFIDYLIHQVDECCWIKDAWPISAQGLGGRAPDSTDCGQNLDSYAIEYTFADGAKALVNGRFIPGCDADFASFVHGTKCAGQFSGNFDWNDPTKMPDQFMFIFWWGVIGGGVLLLLSPWLKKFLAGVRW